MFFFNYKIRCRNKREIKRARSVLRGEPILCMHCFAGIRAAQNSISQSKLLVILRHRAGGRLKRGVCGLRGGGGELVYKTSWLLRLNVAIGLD